MAKLVIANAKSLKFINISDDDFEIVSYSNSFDNYSITSSNPDAVATFNCLNQALQNANLEISDLQTD